MISDSLAYLSRLLLFLSIACVLLLYFMAAKGWSIAPSFEMGREVCVVNGRGREGGGERGERGRGREGGREGRVWEGHTKFMI